MSSNPLIAIDGPGGSGKSTVARRLAARLGLSHLDTGAMYRAVTLLVLESGLDASAGEEAASLARQMELEVGERVHLNGRDVTSAIRSPEVDRAVSAVSAHPAVRAELVARQRAWAERHDGGVVEGRDIGTVVFPQADLKIFLTADPLERARRREAERERAGGPALSPAELERRDLLDASRAVSPLQAARDAIVVDSTGMSIEDVIEEVVSHL